MTPNDRAMILASGAGDIIEAARVYATAAEALSDIRILFATTARGRDVLREILTREGLTGPGTAGGLRRPRHRHPVRQRAGRAGQ